MKSFVIKVEKSGIVQKAALIHQTVKSAAD